MTTWIDVTDISVWNGHHTGTQRVVYEITKRYIDDQDVKFFVFNDLQHTFHEYDFKPVMARIESEKHAKPGPPPIFQATGIRKVALNAFHNSPAVVRRHLTLNRRKLIKKALRKAKHVLRPSHKQQLVITTPPIHFANNDILLIMGKPWDYPYFMNVLRQEKQQYHFKVVQVIYDLIPIFFPHLFGKPLFKPYTQHMFEVGAISDVLLAISKSTKRDMEAFCKDMLLPAPNIEVIRLGDDFTPVEPTKPPIYGLEPGNFILCVGTLEVRKNHQLLYMAYKEGLQRGLKLPKLIIVGSKGWYTNDILYEFNYDPEMRDLVDIGSRNDQELEWLYQNCMFTIYPSVYEGWGLPIAESLARGKVCVSSNTSSMTEIAGDLIDYFSPYNSSECLEAIMKYTKNDVRISKEKEIQNKYKPITWDETYIQTKKFVEELSSSK